MTWQKAVRLYVNSHKGVHLQMILRLMQWNKYATLTQNAKKFKLSIQAAWSFAKAYKLEYRKDKNHGNRRS